MTELALLNLTRKKLFNNDGTKNEKEVIIKQKRNERENFFFKKIEIKEIEIK